MLGVVWGGGGGRRCLKVFVTFLISYPKTEVRSTSYTRPPLQKANSLRLPTVHERRHHRSCLQNSAQTTENQVFDRGKVGQKVKVHKSKPQ